jgi:uncharacterized protein (DUF433 family)
MMTDDELRQRIVITPGVMGGKPCVRGTRLTVRYLVGLLAHGATLSEILTDHPSLSEEDILAALRFAADVVDQLPQVAASA